MTTPNQQTVPCLSNDDHLATARAATALAYSYAVQLVDWALYSDQFEILDLAEQAKRTLSGPVTHEAILEASTLFEQIRKWEPRGDVAVKAEQAVKALCVAGVNLEAADREGSSPCDPE